VGEYEFPETTPSSFAVHPTIEGNWDGKTSKYQEDA
jgi:hypothetical protein